MKSIYLHRWMLLWLVWLIPYSTSLLAEIADCEKPFDLSVSAIGESGVTLNWNTNGAHIDYKVEVRSKGRTSKLKWESQTTATSLQVEGLIPGSTYKFRVKAQCLEGGSSGSTKWFSFSTLGMNPDESCPKATDLEVMGLTGNRAVLAWQASEYASHFEVEVRSKGQTPTFFLEKSVLDHMLTVGGLMPDGKYQYRVKTTCENGAFSGSTKWYSFVSTMVDNDECPSPEEINLEDVTASSANVDWTPAPNAEGYEIFLRSDLEDTVYSTMNNDFQFTDLAPDTEYEVQVRSLCPFGISDDFASLLFKTQIGDTAACEMPTDLKG